MDYLLIEFRNNKLNLLGNVVEILVAHKEGDHQDVHIITRLNGKNCALLAINGINNSDWPARRDLKEASPAPKTSSFIGMPDHLHDVGFGDLADGFRFTSCGEHQGTLIVNWIQAQ
ncbi:MAG: hypothetical protein U0401_02870 [Anaerolineae bacterium]